MRRRRQREQQAMITQTTDTQNREMQAWRDEQKAILEAQKQQYKEFRFVNPFEGVENTFEDVTVSQEAARFQMEQGAQQRANIMAGLSGAAGASGIAGLAQTLAQQGTLQSRQVSAEIAQQEQANQAMIAQGAQQAELLQRQGAAAVQSAEFGRQSTLYAAELGEMAGARSGVNQAFANQMAGLSTISQMENARMAARAEIVSGVAQGVGNVIGGIIPG